MSETLNVLSIDLGKSCAKGVLVRSDSADQPKFNPEDTTKQIIEYSKTLAEEPLTRARVIELIRAAAAGFGAEIAAELADLAFFDLDAPLRRLTMPDVPNPHNIDLLNAAVPTVERITEYMTDLLEI